MPAVGPQLGFQDSALKAGAVELPRLENQARRRHRRTTRMFPGPPSRGCANRFPRRSPARACTGRISGNCRRWRGQRRSPNTPPAGRTRRHARCRDWPGCHRGRRKRVVRRRRRENDEVDVTGICFGALERLFGGSRAEVGGQFALRGNAPFANAGAFDDPLVGRVNDLREIVGSSERFPADSRHIL